MRRAMACLLVLLTLPMAQAGYAGAERWRLSISGHHRYIFGDRAIHGYLQIPWEVELQFSLLDGRFSGGSGLARWFDRVEYGSRPQGWIECRLREGSYLDANLRLRKMPRVRFERFPLSGRLEQGVLQLQPGYSPPGNYLAIRYGCESDQAAAGNWFLYASRARNEEGRRQDAETSQQGDHREATISEVKALPPLDGVTLPLREGWHFQQGNEDSAYFARYRLERVVDFNN